MCGEVVYTDADLNYFGLTHYPTISKLGSSWDNCVENAHS